MKKLISLVFFLSILHCLFFWLYPIHFALIRFSEPLHHQCLSRAEALIRTDSKQIFMAIICGKPLDVGSEVHHIFVVLGLIHILVVSGGHYSALQTFLNRILKIRPKMILAILFLYSAMTLFQPPGGRAFLSFATEQFSQRYRLFLTHRKIEVLSGLLSLCLFPHWITSLSFHLSWSLSLLLALIPNSKGSWLKLLWIQALASIIIGSTGSLSLLSNFFLAPLFSFFLFPLGLLLLLPFSQLFKFDVLWEFVIKHSLYFLDQLENYSQTIQLSFSWSKDWISCVSLILIFLCLMKKSQVELQTP